MTSLCAPSLPPLTGIMMTLCATDVLCGTGSCDLVIRGKGLTSSALTILHELLKESCDNMRGYTAHCLQYIAEEPQVWKDECWLVCVCVCIFVRVLVVHCLPR